MKFYFDCMFQIPRHYFMFLNRIIACYTKKQFIIIFKKSSRDIKKLNPQDNNSLNIFLPIEYLYNIIISLFDILMSFKIIVIIYGLAQKETQKRQQII